MKRKRSDIEDALEQENATLRKQIAAKDERIQKLENELAIAENRNAHTFPGGESFSDTGATPHLLNRALERVFTTSGAFTKFLMQSLKNSGVDCTAIAQDTKSVCFERAAHTKFVYQAIVCKVLFTDFENESFNVEAHAFETLDPEERTKENFQRYKHLTTVENPEELVFEDAIDNDFRRLCVTKRKGLVVALGVLGLDDVFGEVFGPQGIRRREFNAVEGKVASSFVRFVMSVFLVHKLTFALHPVARIFRVRDGMQFIERYMEPVVASADSEDDPAISLSVGFMVVPGFHLNRIVVHSRVYTVKGIELNRR